MAKYIPDELEKWRFVPTITTVSAPTAAQMAAGTDITAAISSVSGFQKSGSTVPTPDMSTRFTKTVSGRTTADDSSIEFYRGDDATDVEEVVRALLPEGGSGYICRSHPVNGAPAAITAGAKVDVWPVRVSGNNTAPPAFDEPAKFTVSFSHPVAPVLGATIAA